ncbi:MAG TPA: hypothetical protein ENN58_01050, partial [bacterium]|nr:hypothetical protein [bacterium]
MKKNSPTLRESIQQVLSQISGPITLDVFVKKVLEIYPSSAKKPDSRIRKHLKMEEVGRSVVYLDEKTLIPLRVGAVGVRFPIALSRWHLNKGALPVFPAFKGWISHLDDMQAIKLLDEQGTPMDTGLVSLYYRISGFNESIEVSAFKLKHWLQKNKTRRSDFIHVVIESWEPKCFRLEFEPEKKRRMHQKEIELKNEELADILYDILENSDKERIYVDKAITTAYLRLTDPRGYPGDQWTEVLKKDPRMRCVDYYITYPEKKTLMERMLRGEDPVFKELEFTPEQEKQVYHFRAALKYRKYISRRIEIPGNHTLADFDCQIRNIFGHDTFDHMGGFWKIVRRGQTQRHREIELGSINPLREGSGAGIRIAGLGLQTGDRLKYVYD